MKMINGFKYKGKNLYVGVQKIGDNIIFTLYDLDKVEKIYFDKSDKTLYKIELKEFILDSLKNTEWITDAILAYEIIQDSPHSPFDYDVDTMVKIKEKLLKGI